MIVEFVEHWIPGHWSAQGSVIFLQSRNTRLGSSTFRLNVRRASFSVAEVRKDGRGLEPDSEL